jgi:hypothetical protein
MIPAGNGGLWKKSPDYCGPTVTFTPGFAMGVRLVHLVEV